MEDAEDDDQGDLAPEGTVFLGHRLIANAFRYRTARAADTNIFREMKHDRDLLPKINEQLRYLLESFHRDTNVAYDIQGLSDEGSDLLVRLQTPASSKFVGIQVKSHSEIGAKDIVRDLRDQLSRSEDKYQPLLTWYIFLAGDVSGPANKTQQNIRRIQAAFANKRHVSVIDSVYAYTFLRLTHSQMASLVTLTLRTGDPLQEEARLDLERHPVEAAILLYLVARAVSDNKPIVQFAELLDDSWIHSVAKSAPFGGSAYELIAGDDGDPEEWEEDLDSLPPNRIRQFLTLKPEPPLYCQSDDWREQLAMHLENMPDQIVEQGSSMQAPLYIHNALFALAAEGRVKHELEGTALIDYLISVVLPG